MYLGPGGAARRFAGANQAQLIASDPACPTDSMSRPSPFTVAQAERTSAALKAAKISADFFIVRIPKRE